MAVIYVIFAQSASSINYDEIRLAAAPLAQHHLNVSILAPPSATAAVTNSGG